ncbi:MAG: hypothetical protein KDC48_17200, partial [Planctomycetes bacterium]|nr:hypothetical protein [Planctomycetota bacterium]
PPTYRQKEWTATQRIGGTRAPTPVRDLLSGDSIVDLCTDDLRNFGGFPGQLTPFNASYQATPFIHSGKHVLKASGGNVVAAVLPRLLFVALSDVGKVDVFEISTGTRRATIDAPGVRVVSSYWRQ